jgi:membrane protein required for colicin V production
MNLTPNSVDGILFFVLFVFAFLAFLKGFVKEFFSTLNLIIAIITSYIASPFISKLFVNVEAPQILVDLGVQFIVFVVILIVCSIISSKISNPLSEKIPHFLNQSLGFGFGFLKGYLIISFIFAILLFFYSSNPLSKEPETKIVDSKKQEKFGPAWFQDSKSYDVLYYGADVIKPLVDGILSQIKNSGNDDKAGPEDADSLDTVNKIIKTQKLYDQMLKDENNPIPPETTEPQSQEADPASQQKNETGYTDQEIKKMKRLIEIMSN